MERGQCYEGTFVRRAEPSTRFGNVQVTAVVITMACGDACPIYPGKRYEHWALLDPAGLDLAAVRPIRDEINRRVGQLLAELVATHG